MNKKSQTLEIVYDDQCPVCKAYCRNIVVDDAYSLQLIDARKKSSQMDDITQRGFDIDQGMILKIGETYYYGSAAMHKIALVSKKNGPLALFNRLFFSSAFRAKIFYSIGKTLRNCLLRLLGIKSINNLKIDNNAFKNKPEN